MVGGERGKGGCDAGLVFLGEGGGDGVLEGWRLGWRVGNGWGVGCGWGDGAVVWEGESAVLFAVFGGEFDERVDWLRVDAFG